MTSSKGSRLLSFFPKISRRKNQVLIIDTPSTIAPELDTQETQLECKGASKFSQAPQDVLFLIADHLDTATQASLIRTCRYFHQTLEVNLYRRIAPALPWSYYSNDSLFRTLMERQDLLPKIRTYHGPFLQAIVGSLPKRRFQDRSNPRGRLSLANFDALPINETAGFKRVVTIFEKATNIVDLNFTDGSTWTSDPLFEPIRTAVSKMSLRKLTLWRCNGLVQVLRDQPGLEELRLGWNSPEIEQLEETDVPKLKALAATLQEAALLVPGRPIERLSLIPTGSGLQDFDEQLFSKFLLSTTRIAALSVHLQPTRRGEEVRAAIRVITRTLPELEKLTITVGGPISGRIILDEIPSLQSIRCLTFLGARLATAADQASSVADDSTQAEDEDDSIPQAPAVEDWDDLFAHLRKLCPLLVGISYTT